MHAVVVTSTIGQGPGQQAEALEFLRANVLPRVREMPGVVAGYWLMPKDGQGQSITIYQDEASARAAAEMIPNRPTPPHVTLNSIEVREVAANV
jgi:hypothetical protein